MKKKPMPLSFNLRPMNNSATLLRPPSRVNIKTGLLSFAVDFSNLLTSRFQIPKEIDGYWYKIGCRTSFTEFYINIQSPLSFNVIKSFFDPENKCNNELVNQFHDFSKNMKFIFPSLNLATFISQPKLDLNNLFSLVSEETRILFSSVVRMIDSLVHDRAYSEQNYIILNFAQLLIPKEAPTDVYGRNPVSVFAPVSNKLEYFWAVLFQDKSVQLYKISKGCPLTQNVRCGCYTCGPTSLLVDGVEYLFLSTNGSDTFKNSLADPKNVKYFVQSFKGTDHCANLFPEIIISRLVTLMSSTDFNLVNAIFQSIVDSRDYTTASDLLSCLNESGTFAPFLRYTFMDSVNKTDNPSILFNTTSIANNIASAIMTHYGAHLVAPIVEQVRSHKNDPIGSIAIIISHCSRLPPPMRFVMLQAFKSTRRKFPGELTPAVSLGSIFLSRFLMPALGNDPELISIGKHVVKAFMLKKEDKSVKDEGLLKSIAAFLLDMTRIETQNMKFSDYNFATIVKFLDHQNNTIIKNFDKKSDLNGNPLTWSIVEIIENCFVGCEENFASDIHASQLFK